MPNVPEAPIYPLLQGKVALVTGAAQGMGRATAEVFVKAGARVVICDVKPEGAAVAEELSKHGGECVFVRTDISKADEVRSLIAQTVERFGRLDVAVNNAALTPDNTPLVDFDEAYWEKLMSINLTGNALLVKYEMQQMIKQGEAGGARGGSIVNIASINAFRPQPNMPAYTSAKFALIGLTKHASMEGGPHGIRVNAICPGAIYTEMSASALKIMNLTEDEFTPKVSYLRRFGMPHEVAQASMWLCSDASSYVTGIPLPVDGGYLAM